MLDKDGFLKLLVASSSSQDPMAAVSNEEIMGQMTQLSMVEQVTNLTKANEQLVARMQTSQALGLIGHTVSYTTDAAPPGPAWSTRSRSTRASPASPSAT